MRGFANLGNTCYFSSTLQVVFFSFIPFFLLSSLVCSRQALANLPAFHAYLILLRHHLSKALDQKSLSFLDHLLECLLLHEQRPFMLKASLCSFAAGAFFANYDQHVIEQRQRRRDGRLEERIGIVSLSSCFLFSSLICHSLRSRICPVLLFQLPFSSFSPFLLVCSDRPRVISLNAFLRSLSRRAAGVCVCSGCA